MDGVSGKSQQTYGLSVPVNLARQILGETSLCSPDTTPESTNFNIRVDTP